VETGHPSDIIEKRGSQAPMSSGGRPRRYSWLTGEFRSSARWEAVVAVIGLIIELALDFVA